MLSSINREYSLYGLIIVGVFLTVFGARLLFQKGYVEKLMSKGGMWEHEENDMMSKKDEYEYNKYGRGIKFLLSGILFLYLGIWLLR